MSVENRVYDAILTYMENVVIPRVDMTVRPITGSSKYGPSSLVQNPQQRDFSGIMENTPLTSTSSRVDLNNDHDRNEDICIV